MHKILQVATKITKAMTVRNNNSSRLEAWFLGGMQGISKLCQHMSTIIQFYGISPTACAGCQGVEVMDGDFI